tara:strand:+ start:1027 stop:2376 length:1350 start_codon:yes stop_codon:yes gene_type:complete
MIRDPRTPRQVLSNRIIKKGVWAIHSEPVTIIKIDFKNLRCREAGVKEDPLLVHAIRLTEELEALSAKDILRVFGLPINLARKLLEMLLYRDLVQESIKRKSLLFSRKRGFLFEEDSEDAKRHREDPIFDQMFELTEAGYLASKEGEIRPIISRNLTLYMIEETGEFLPIETSFSGGKWEKINWKTDKSLSNKVIANWFTAEQRNVHKVDDSIEGFSEHETVRKDDFGIEFASWPATKAKVYSAKVSGIWLIRTLVGKPSIHLKDVQVGSTKILSSIGDVEFESNESLTGTLGEIDFRKQSSKPRVHKNMLSIQIAEHEHRDLPSKSKPKPHRVQFSMGNEIVVEALLRPIPSQKKILSWIDDAVDDAMRKLPEGKLGRVGVDSEVEHLKQSIEELWMDSKNLPKKWIETLEGTLENLSLKSILDRYREVGEWELQYRIDEEEVFIHAY